LHQQIFLNKITQLSEFNFTILDIFRMNCPSYGTMFKLNESL